MQFTWNGGTEGAERHNSGFRRSSPAPEGVVVLLQKSPSPPAASRLLLWFALLCTHTHTHTLSLSLFVCVVVFRVPLWHEGHTHSWSVEAVCTGTCTRMLSVVGAVFLQIHTHTHTLSLFPTLCHSPCTCAGFAGERTLTPVRVCVSSGGCCCC